MTPLIKVVSEHDDASVTTHCVRLMLRPVLRFCLRHSIKIQQLIESCKVVLIELAAEQIQGSGSEVSHSRLSVMTGLHRRDVIRIYKHGETRNEPFNVLAKITGQWEQNRNFTTMIGKPKVLTLEGPASEFSSLVRSVTQDLKPQTVLFELERLGLIERTARGIKLCAKVYNPAGDNTDAARMFGRHTEHMMSAIEENMAQAKLPGMKLPNFHILTRYDNIIEEAVPQLREWILNEGTKFHERVRKQLARHDQDVNEKLDQKLGGVEIVVGGFSRVIYADHQASSVTSS